MRPYEDHLSEATEKGTITDKEAGFIRAFLAEYNAITSPDAMTLRNRYYQLFSLVCLCRDRGIDLPEASTLDILTIVTTIKNRSDYSDNYKRMQVSLLKSVCDSIPGIDMKKVRSIKLPKVPWKSKKPEDMLTREEVLKVLAACENTRDRCLLSMVYDGSTRAIELLRLNWCDLIQDDLGYWFQTDGKTGRVRKIRFTTSIPYIEQWQNDYSAHNGVPEGEKPVFITLHDPRTRLTKGGYDRRVYDIQKKTGIRKLKPGIMRSTRITHDVEAGYDPLYIMKKNWGNLGTTMLDKYANPSGDWIDSKAMEYAGLKKADKVKVVDPLQPVQCPSCHTVNEPGNKHCKECGWSLARDAEKERQEVLKYLLEHPDAIMEAVERGSKIDRTLD